MYGGVQIQFHALDSNRWRQLVSLMLQTLSLRERNRSIHWIGGWVDSRTNTDEVDRSKVSDPAGNSVKIPWSSSPWLSHCTDSTMQKSVKNFSQLKKWGTTSCFILHSCYCPPQTCTSAKHMTRLPKLPLPVSGHVNLIWWKVSHIKIFICTDNITGSTLSYWEELSLPMHALG
jgi:hypothetical protein